MMRRSTTTIAITSSRWITPPSVYDVAIPSSQRTSRTTITVESMMVFPFSTTVENRDGCRCSVVNTSVVSPSDARRSLRIRAWASHGASRGRDRPRCAIEHSAGSASEATSWHVKECASRADGRNLVHDDDDDRRTVHCPGRADDDREQRAVTGGVRRSAAHPPPRMECCANRAAGYKLNEPPAVP